MRLIHFTASDVWRGHEQKIIYLYEVFRDKGYTEEQWIICPENSEILKVAQSKGLNVVTFNLKQSKLKSARFLKQFAEANRTELIFIHSSKAQTMSVLASLVYRMKIPLVLCRTLIKKVDTNFLRKWKYNYPGIKKIICLTKAVQDALEPAINDRSRLSIVGPLTDMSRFNPDMKMEILRKEFNIPGDYKIIGNVSAFVPVKDHATWINVAEELIRGQLKAKFVLVGIGPLEAEIKQLVKSKGLEDHVYFAGFRTNVPEILPEFDLLIFTSTAEAAGSIILECYASKVPVVATNAGGIPEVLVDGETGFLAQAGNAADFADKAMTLLNDSALAHTMKENGYRYLAENFSKEVIADKMFNELNAVYQSAK